MSSEADVTIRIYREADRGAVMDLVSRLTEGIAPWIDQCNMTLAARSWVESSLAVNGEDATVLVASSDTGCLGFVSVSCKTHFTGVRQVYVDELVVAQEAEGRGIGRMLMHAAERWAREHDCRQVTLKTGAGNQPARSIYGRLGYQDESVTLAKMLD